MTQELPENIRTIVDGFNLPGQKIAAFWDAWGLITERLSVLFKTLNSQFEITGPFDMMVCIASERRDEISMREVEDCRAIHAIDLYFRPQDQHERYTHEINQLIDGLRGRDEAAEAGMIFNGRDLKLASALCALMRKLDEMD